MKPSLCNASLKEAYWSALDYLTFFSGRSSRSEYWWVVATINLVPFILMCVGIIGSCMEFEPYPDIPSDVYIPKKSEQNYLFISGLGVLCSIVVFFCTLSLTVRRLHDMGKSGWWCSLYLIPYLGVVIMGIILLYPSQPFANKYGEIVQSSRNKNDDNTQNSASSNASSQLKELKKLVDLRDTGILSDEEFEKLKSNLLKSWLK